MDETALTEKIIERLAAGEHVEDIAFAISDRTGESYPQVEALVRRVQEENESRIVQKQSPLLVTLAIVIFLGGIVLLGSGTYIIASAVIAYYPRQGGPIHFTAFLFMLYQFAPQGLYLAGAGFLAVLGSLAGMQKVWVALLDKRFPKTGENRREHHERRTQ